MITENKLAKVHSLPTEDKTDVLINTYLHKDGNQLTHISNVTNGSTSDITELIERGYSPQHLYFTTDEEIKDGDNAISLNGGENGEDVLFVAKNITYHKTCRKIVVTTDPKLEISATGYTEDRARTFYEKIPQPPQSFIKEYCEKGGIDEVLLEYYDVMYGKVPYDWYNYNDAIYKIKTDSNNCVIIHSVKTSWTKEEVDDLPIHIHEGIYNTYVYIKDGVIHVEPNKK